MRLLVPLIDHLEKHVNSVLGVIDCVTRLLGDTQIEIIHTRNAHASPLKAPTNQQQLRSTPTNLRWLDCSHGLVTTALQRLGRVQVVVETEHLVPQQALAGSACRWKLDDAFHLWPE